jgi:hypothetical protein
MKISTNTIVKLLKNKAAVKQDIADYSESVMKKFKVVVQEELETLRLKINDPRVRLRYSEKGVHEFILYVGSDVLVFQLHRNVFRLPDESALWKNDYLKSNEMNGYFGIINIYNFLAESFEQNRFNDAGYLIGRVFMNHNSHFMVEGRGQLGTLFNDIANSELKDEDVRKIIQCAVIYAIEFDLLTPPYDLIQELTVMEIQSISTELQTATGKRMGFKFSAEGREIQ